MKKLIAFALLFFCAPVFAAAPPVVQYKSAAGAANPYVASFTSLPTTGHPVVVVIESRSSVAPTVVDNQSGNTFVKIDGTLSPSGYSNAQVWWCPSITAATGTYTVSVTVSGINVEGGISIMELAPPSGATGVAVDKHNIGSISAGTTFSVTNAAANTNATDLVVAAISQQYVSGGNGLTTPPSSGYTAMDYNDANPELGDGYKSTTGIETSAASWTSTTSAEAAAVIVTFEGTSVPTGNPLPYYSNLFANVTGSVTLTGTGFSGTAPTYICKYTAINWTVTVTCPSGTGTSNATSYTMTGLPSTLQPLTQTQLVPLAVVEDNTATAVTGAAEITALSGTVTLLKGGSATGWTGSGTKGIPTGANVTFSYSVQ